MLISGSAWYQHHSVGRQRRGHCAGRALPANSSAKASRLLRLRRRRGTAYRADGGSHQIAGAVLSADRGGCLLLWIGFQLLSGDDEAEGEGKTYGSLMAAVRTIVIADLVMSLDNVIAVAVAVAVAAAAQGNVILLVLGLAISIPLVIFGSTLMIKLMDRSPIIIVLGAALIGWVGGETIANDAVLHGYAVAHPAFHYIAAALGAALVVGVGKLRRARQHGASEIRDLTSGVWIMDHIDAGRINVTKMASI